MTEPIATTSTVIPAAATTTVPTTKPTTAEPEIVLDTSRATRRPTAATTTGPTLMDAMLSGAGAWPVMLGMAAGPAVQSAASDEKRSHRRSSGRSAGRRSPPQVEDVTTDEDGYDDEESGSATGTDDDDDDHAEEDDGDDAEEEPAAGRSAVEVQMTKQERYLENINTTSGMLLHAQTIRDIDAVALRSNLLGAIDHPIELYKAAVHGLLAVIEMTQHGLPDEPVSFPMARSDASADAKQAAVPSVLPAVPAAAAPKKKSSSSSSSRRRTSSRRRSSAKA